MTALSFGVRENQGQFTHKLIQVLLVGCATGLMHTVIPELAETELRVARGSFVLLTAFVVAFAVVKAVLRFVAGRLSGRIERQRVLLWGFDHRLAHFGGALRCAELRLDRRGDNFTWGQSGLVPADDENLKAGHHARRPTRADDGCDRGFPAMSAWRWPG